VIKNNRREFTDTLC